MLKLQKQSIKPRPTYSQVIALGFVAIILAGAVLLSLPVSSKSREWTSAVDAIFTSASAVCVTGLVVTDTYMHWSGFGQAVILLLIQVGGIGFMTVITMFLVFLKKKIGLHERQLFAHSAGMLRSSGVVRIIKRVIVCAFGFEAAGALLLSIRFCQKMGFWEGLYNAVFHSVSAFCNAGFDLLGKYGEYTSFAAFVNDPLVNITTAILVVMGGMGFLVWNDVLEKKLKVSKYELHTKIVLATTAALVVSGWIMFYLFESGKAYSEMSIPQKILASFFQAVSPRTAGITTLSTSEMSEGSVFLTVVLMFIGGSPGSTAGGIKTTTLAVLVMSAIAAARRVKSVTIFKRKIEDGLVRQAGAFLTFYLLTVVISTLALCAVEPYSLKEILFEVVSAIGTVGLTLGITPKLTIAAKIMITILMFIGRIGWLTMFFAFFGKYREPSIERAEEKVLIG